MRDIVDDYVKELGEVLRSLEPNRMRGFVDKHKYLYTPKMVKTIKAKDDKWILGLMAKTLLGRTDMDEPTKDKAKYILKEMGWNERI